MGANPVQIEVGEFDEAIEIVEDDAVESRFTHKRLILDLLKLSLGLEFHLNSLCWSTKSGERLKSELSAHEMSIFCSNVAAFCSSLLLQPSLDPAGGKASVF